MYHKRRRCKKKLLKTSKGGDITFKFSHPRCCATGIGCTVVEITPVARRDEWFGEVHTGLIPRILAYCQIPPKTIFSLRLSGLLYVFPQINYTLIDEARVQN